MQIIPLFFSGLWIASSSVGFGVPQYMSTPTAIVLTEKHMRPYLLASTPSILAPIYTSPSPLLSATGTVTLTPKQYTQKIYRYAEQYAPVTYAWEQWKDIDFILMIQEESLWDEYISGDSGASIGYCQFNSYHSPREYAQYIALTSWQSRIDLCHVYYERFRDNVGEVLHGWNSRERNMPSFSFR